MLPNYSLGVKVNLCVAPLQNLMSYYANDRLNPNADTVENFNDNLEHDQEAVFYGHDHILVEVEPSATQKLVENTRKRRRRKNWMDQIVFESNVTD